jgi:predicted nucleic acid-binding protein
VGYKTLITIERYPNLLVLDNSLVMRWFFNDGSDSDLEYAEAVLGYMKINDVKPVVPTLWVSEACFVSNGYVKNKKHSTAIVEEKLVNAFDMFLVVDPKLEPKTLFAYANRHNIPDYDANYALLAANLNCPIATLDKRLGKAVVKANGSLLEKFK